MNCPICSWTKQNTDYPFIYETPCWIVKLAPNQCLLGRCVISTQRHVGDLALLTQQEKGDFFDIVRQLETALRQAFDATMFNWSCYMNHAYRDASPDPHVHWWMVPRYNGERTLDDLTFEDPHFGDPYDHYRRRDVSVETKLQIVEKIAAALPR